jgi:hypothetical protein
MAPARVCAFFTFGAAPETAGSALAVGEDTPPPLSWPAIDPIANAPATTAAAARTAGAIQRRGTRTSPGSGPGRCLSPSRAAPAPARGRASRSVSASAGSTPGSGSRAASASRARAESLRQSPAHRCLGEVIACDSTRSP